jgi:tRNA-2-methylthio-N6-dimethylallyladenosine synthase
MSTPPTKPEPVGGRSIYLETFGCQMNVLDSQLVRGQLQGAGYRFTDDWRSADVVLYNTCSVREHAEQKVWSRIGEIGQLKKDRPGIVLGVIGCMAERDGQDMIRRHPQVDLICGPGELDKVPLLVNNAVRTAMTSETGFRGLRHAGVALQGNTHRRSGTLAAAEDQLELIDLSRSFSAQEIESDGRSAYVRITRGCNKFCTYCVVPHTRGAEVHRPPHHIVEECRRLVVAGAVEVTLLGQTVNHYQFDHGAAVTVNGVVQPQVGAVVNHAKARVATADGGDAQTSADHGGSPGVTTFAQLLARVHDEVPGLRRLRFVTSFPRDFGDDILRVMADRPRICRYLHVPVQSGSDRMLRAMNRGYTVEQYLAFIERVRRHLPDAELATDIICGFPGETEQDHRATAELLSRVRFKNSFIFKYSPRPGTVAYDRLTDDVPEPVKKRRNNELLAIQAQISAEVHRAYVGRTVRVFVESISAKAKKSNGGSSTLPGGNVTLGWEKPREVTQLSGRTDGDLIVCFEGDRSLIGSIVEVEVADSAPLTLFGRLATVEAAPVPAC